MNLGKVWTVAMDVELARLLAQGLTYRACANELSQTFGARVTRCAAIGRGHRLGLHAAPPPTPAKASEPEKPPPTPKVRRIGKAASGRRRKCPRTSSRRRASSRAVTLFELAAGHCRWPVEQWDETGGCLFCGAPANLAQARSRTAEASTPDKARGGHLVRKLLGLAIFGQVCIAIAAGGVLTVMVRGITAFGARPASPVARRRKPPDARMQLLVLARRLAAAAAAMPSAIGDGAKASLYWEADAEARTAA